MTITSTTNTSLTSPSGNIKTGSDGTTAYTLAVLVDETAPTIPSPATGVAQDAGGAGPSGWFSSMVKNLRLIVTALTGNLSIIDAFAAPAVSTWTSATALNTAQTNNTSGYDTAVVTMIPSGTITAGAITFEVYDGVNWLPVKAARTESYNTESSYLLTGGTRSWQVSVGGFTEFRTRLSTVISGSGSVGLTTIISSAPDTSVVTAGLDPTQPMPAGENHMGAVGGTTLRPNWSITRPSTTPTYVAGDAIVDTSAGTYSSVANFTRKSGGSGTILGGVLLKSNSSAYAAAERTYLFSAAPTNAPTDGAIWQPAMADMPGLLGYIDWIKPQVFGSGSTGVVYYTGLPDQSLASVAMAGGVNTLYAVHLANGGYTAVASEVRQFALSLNGD